MGHRRPPVPLLAALGAAGLTLAACTSAGAADGDLPPYVFSSDEGGGDPEIHVRHGDGTVVALTDNDVADHGAVWSPDGEQLAFVRGAPEGGGDQIWVMDADGGNQRPLTEPGVTADGVPHLNMSPAWSPDGGRIAFVSNRDGAEMKIYVMDADGNGETRLTFSDPFVTDHAPSWSPDGEHLVFSSNRDGVSNVEIYRMRADGSDVRRLTTTGDGVDDNAPEYSPDGSRIVFSSTRGGAAHDLWTMDADGGDPRELAGEPGWVDDVFGHWTPDGQRVMFQTFETEDAPDAVWIVDADGSDRTRLSDGSAREAFPDPAPGPR